MTVFKAYTKVLKACITTIILYTVILILFAGLNLETQDTSSTFSAAKPDIAIVNLDQNHALTNNFIQYLESRANIKEIDTNEISLDDALFYRDISYIIYIPEHFGRDFLNQKNPEIQIKSTGDYEASLANILVERYLSVASLYNKEDISFEELLEHINSTINNEVTLEVKSTTDTTKLTKATFYYNFANYSFIAGCVYVVSIILASFKEKNVRKRTIISSMDYRKYNRHLLLSNGLFVFVLWLFYVILSFFLVGSVMFTAHGLLLIFNSFLLVSCCLSLAFMIGNVITDKNAINGIVNVVALGSSFLCGAFVPPEYLPDFVIKTAHLLPSYYYINNNEMIKGLEIINFETLKPILINGSIIILFSVGMIIITNVILSKKRKID